MTRLVAKALVAAIDAALERNQDMQHRWHLGASIIGKECPRQIWYSWRWVKKEQFNGRMLRLFDRGHREEARINTWLRATGIRVNDTCAETGKQWSISMYEGHFGGSLDAILEEVLMLPDGHTTAVGEYKTHSAKSFAKLQAEGVRKAKPEHYSQVNVYMYARAIPVAVYIAVCKDDDEIYIEIIPYDDAEAQRCRVRAKALIDAQLPPQRISADPAYWTCKMCLFRKVCHGKQVPDVNCRTCAHVSVSEKGTWTCTRHGHIFTKEMEEATASFRDEVDGYRQTLPPRMHDGCRDHVFNPYLINGVTFVGGDNARNCAHLQLPDGRVIANGPNDVLSDQLQNYIGE